jgi:hypothetical protein
MRLTAIAALLLAAGAAQAGGVVNVTFVEPEKFYDAGNNKHEEPINLKVIEQFLQDLGKRYLPDGQVLNLEVLDVDLAGYVRPTRTGTELRVVRGKADWPSFSLRYDLVAGGQSLKHGEERVKDLTYTGHIQSYGTRDPLRYEKQMLDAWFRERFTAPQ